ncbi:MAG: tetratricopeptide repeat protein [Ferruginibacter sp.]
MKNLLYILSIFASYTLSAQTQDSAQFYFNKGKEEKDAKKYLMATKAFETAIKFNPAFIEAYLENANSYMQMRKIEFAKTNFTKVYDLQPSNKVAIRELTDLYYSYRQYPKAIEFAQRCSDCENAQHIIGMSYYQQEDYPSAEKALKVALAKNPADAEATYTLARTYLDMEEYKKALPYYEKAVSMEGSKNTWMYELGLLYYNNNDFKNAVTSFDNAAKNGYTTSNDFNENYGYAALYSGNYEKGESMLNEIYRRKPGNKDVLRDMAEIFYKQKQFDKSLQYCQKLMEMDAKDGKALYQAGLCFQKKGQKDRGEQMCDKAIEMDPSLTSMRQKKEMPGM